MKSLIVIDMQNDFIDGVLGTKEAVAILPNVKKKIAEYTQSCNDVMYTKDTHGSDYMDTSEGKHLPIPHCVRGSSGWEIVDGLYVDGCDVIHKDRFGYNNWFTFYNIPGFRDGDEVELVGVCTDICVVSNALIMKAQLPNVTITVDASCCAGTTPENHKAALRVMKSCQINVINE